MDLRLQENLNEVRQNYIAPFMWLHAESDDLIVKEIERVYDSGIYDILIGSSSRDIRLQCEYMYNKECPYTLNYEAVQIMG